MKYKSMNSLQSPRFSGVKTFMRIQNIRSVKDLPIVGFDAAEVASFFDPSNITSITAAGLIQEFMSQAAYKKKMGGKKE